MKREAGVIVGSFQSPYQLPTFQEDQCVQQRMPWDRETKIKTGRWSPEEHLEFIKGTPAVLLIPSLGLQVYGRNWSTIQRLVPTRTASQIRTHAQKFFIRLEGERGKGDLLAYVRGKPASHFVDEGRAYARLSAGKDSESAEDQKSLLGQVPGVDAACEDMEARGQCEAVVGPKRRRLSPDEAIEGGLPMPSGLPVPQHNLMSLPLEVPQIPMAGNTSMHISHTFNQGQIKDLRWNNFNAGDEQNAAALYFRGGPPTPASSYPTTVMTNEKLSLLQQSAAHLTALTQSIASDSLVTRQQPWKNPQKEELLDHFAGYTYRLSQVVSELLRMNFIMNGNTPTEFGKLPIFLH